MGIGMKSTKYLTGFFFKRFYLFIIFRQRGREREREREKHQCVAAFYAPSYWEPVLQPRHVPWRGIKLATLWFKGWRSIHWATPARAQMSILGDCVDGVATTEIWEECIFCHVSFEISMGSPGESMRQKVGYVILKLGKSMGRQYGYENQQHYR